METQGLTKLQALVTSTAGPLERIELGDGISDSRLSSEGDLELWRRILSASIQPPPDAGETLALTRSAGERAWWREVCRGPRQATRPFRTGNR
jgi:hypothetical protein